MGQKKERNIDAKDLLFTYLSIVAACLLIHQVTRRDELEKYKSIPMFKKNVEGHVGTASQWVNFYSLPVIGVLTNLHSKLGKHSKDLETVPVSIVRMMQSAGAQVIPISVSLSDDELKLVMKSVNGIFIPDHTQQTINSENGYMDIDQFNNAVEKILKWIKEDEYNLHRSDMPILASSKISTMSSSSLSGGKVETHSLFTGPNIWDGYDCLNMHQPENSNFQVYPLFNKSTNYQSEMSKNCARMIKHKQLPFYITSFLSLQYSASDQAWNSSTSESERFYRQKVTNFFVGQAKNNKNRFLNPVQFHISNIENFPVFVSGVLGSSYIIKGL